MIVPDDSDIVGAVSGGVVTETLIEAPPHVAPAVSMLVMPVLLNCTVTVVDVDLMIVAPLVTVQPAVVPPVSV